MKRYILLIFTVLLPALNCIIYADNITTTAQTNGAYNAISTSAATALTTTTLEGGTYNSVSGTTKSADATGSTTAAVCLPPDEYMQMQLKELHLDVTPTFKFVLPDTDFKINISNKFENSLFEAFTEYNYLYSKINYMLRYTLDIFLQPFVSLYDDTDFEKVYADSKYIQRTKGLSGGVKTPMLGDIFLLSAEAKNESFYNANLQDNLNVNQGNMNLVDGNFEIFDKKKETSDYYFQANVEKSIPAGNSSYNYMFLNIDAHKSLKIMSGNEITDIFEGGYLLQQDDVPQWKLYYLGGYDRLAGYGFEQFYGYYKIFNRFKFSIQILNNVGWELGWKQFTAKWNDMDAFLLFDSGCVGNVGEIQGIQNYHFSVGAGVRFGCILGKTSKVKFTFMLAQAIIYNKSLPVFYFVQEF
jgi:hypothetical protein